ncbi:hypothetical protein PENTCL1PPCAC_24500, partial [Pristionchus entomophagus]
SRSAIDPASLFLHPSELYDPCCSTMELISPVYLNSRDSSRSSSPEQPSIPHQSVAVNPNPVNPLIQRDPLNTNTNMNLLTPSNPPTDNHNSFHSSRFADDFKMMDILGVGAYGIVLKCLKTSFPCSICAIKRISVDVNSASSKSTARREVAAMTQLCHPGVVSYRDSWTETPPLFSQMQADAEILMRFGSSKLPMHHRQSPTTTFLYIQMELCNYSLADWIKKQDATPRDILRMHMWFRQIVSAVAYIHEKGFIHRDLKPSNILFDRANSPKICDLGITTELTHLDGQEITNTYTNIGSALYMAPEQRIWRYTSKVDVFALGLILAEMCMIMTAAERFE